MENNTLGLAVVIVDSGMGSKVLKVASQFGITVGLIVLGMGTLKNRILEFLQIADVRKEIVIMAAPETKLSEAMDAVNERFHLEKPFHGIAFTMPLPTLAGFGNFNYNHHVPTERKEPSMIQTIITIVERGKAEEVMLAATKAGARGGTIIKARGAGEYVKDTLFHMDIEPEKEVVLILSAFESVEPITTAIRGIFENGVSGIIMVQDVSKTYGVNI